MRQHLCRSRRVLQRTVCHPRAVLPVLHVVALNWRESSSECKQQRAGQSRRSGHPYASISRAINALSAHARQTLRAHTQICAASCTFPYTLVCYSRRSPTTCMTMVHWASTRRFPSGSGGGALSQYSSCAMHSQVRHCESCWGEGRCDSVVGVVVWCTGSILLGDERLLMVTISQDPAAVGTTLSRW